MFRSIYVFPAFVLLSVVTNPARAFDCPDGIAGVGDSRYEIRHKCGEPALTTKSQESRITETKGAYTQDFIPVEYWLYNPGPERFVTVVVFEQDKVAGTRTYGYGRTGSEPDFNKTVKIGDPAVLVLFLYGPPSDREERVDTSVVSLKTGATLPRVTSVEIWTYNLGPSRFMRIYHFNNGILKKIETGDRGF